MYIARTVVHVCNSWGTVFNSIGAASLQLLECLELLELCSWKRAVAILEHGPEIADWSKNGLNRNFCYNFSYFSFPTLRKRSLV
jgi:hypothetical protein